MYGALKTRGIKYSNVETLLLFAPPFKKFWLRAWLTEAGFVFLLHKLLLYVSLVDWCAQIRLDVRISLLEKESSTGSMLLSAWGATSIQWNT